jgi:hypothetical protein
MLNDVAPLALPRRLTIIAARRKKCFRKAAHAGGMIPVTTAGERGKHVRYSTRCLAATLLVCVSTSQAQVGEVNALAAADWKTNLTIGPNGPIPVIVVDQFGYLTKSKKVAVIRDPQIGYDGSVKFEPNKSYALIEFPSGKVVKSAPPTVWSGGMTDQASGDKARWFDFSEIEAPGRQISRSASTSTKMS